jgi:hypothetical protein
VRLLDFVEHRRSLERTSLITNDINNESRPPFARFFLAFLGVFDVKSTSLAESKVDVLARSPLGLERSDVCEFPLVFHADNGEAKSF